MTPSSSDHSSADLQPSNSQSHSSSTAVQTVTLGPSGPTVSALGIGTWAWGDKLFWGYGNQYGEAELEAAFEAAIAAGVTFFDTAEVYGFGESERILGHLQRQTQTPVQIATKYFPLPWRFSANAISDALTASLTRLGQTSVDLYQVHWPLDFLMGQRKLMEALAEEVKRGRIRSVGVSNYSADQMRQAHDYLEEQGVPLAVNQMQYSLLARQIEQNDVMAAAKERGITILAYSPLSQGLLTGKYSAEQYSKPVGARRLDPKFSEAGLRKLEPLLTALQEIAQARGKTPAQVALNWIMAQGVVPIPGAKDAKQAGQNAGSLGWSLTAAECHQLEAESDRIQ